MRLCLRFSTASLTFLSWCILPGSILQQIYVHIKHEGEEEELCTRDRYCFKIFLGRVEKGGGGGGSSWAEDTDIQPSLELRY
jgi:hypothetical protein